MQPDVVIVAYGTLVNIMHVARDLAVQRKGASDILDLVYSKL